MDPVAIAEPTKWLGETIGFWIQTSVLAVSAVGAIWIIKASKNQEKRRATIDAVVDQKRNKELQDARLLIQKLHETGEKNFSRYLANIDSPEYQAIVLTLNTYEFMAVGIRAGALDEKTYKRLRCSTLLKDWEALCAFVVDFRRAKGRASLFQDFQWLNDRWVKKPLKTDQPFNH